jgi:hypothetical protein
MIEEPRIQGFKKSEFTNATPDRVFGTADVQIEDLPNGVRLYLREKAVDLGDKKVSINVYRLKDDGGTKQKRVWCGRMKLNRVPQDDEIAELFGGGLYVWILKWTGADGKEAGIISEPIEVDEESGRALHEAWKQRQAPAASTPAGPAVAPPQSNGVDIAGILQIMAATEEKTIASMERMAAIFQGQKQETPAEILKSAYTGAAEMISKAVESNMAMANTVRKAQVAQVVRELEPPEDEEDDDPAPETAGPQVPAFLRPFVPMLEKGLSRLLEGGPIGAATKALVLSDDEFKAVLNDPDKWSQVVSYIESKYGSEKTTRALDILLNRRPKAAAGAKKGKGK